MSKLSRSSDIGKFQKESYIKRCEEQNHEPSADYLDMFDRIERHRLDCERDPEWQVLNLEYDLRTTDWILKKVRNSEAYAQNLYAALCNNEFQKRDVMPILQDKTWSCTWRYAGGIIAHMREQGDYMDWYCSGIRGVPTEQEYMSMTDQEKQVLEQMQGYVPEGEVADQIAQDLKELGWLWKEYEDNSV